MKTVLITGITGKSGRALLNCMLAESERVREFRFLAVCRHAEGIEASARAAGVDLTVVQADLTDAAACDGLFADPVDTVLHIAGIFTSEQVVSAALRHGVDRFILVHTTGIFSRYKAAGEDYRRIEKTIADECERVRADGRNVQVTVLRPTMIYGDLQDKNISAFIRMVDKLRLFPVVNGGRYALQPVWCEDLGRAYWEVLLRWETTGGKEYILSGGEPLLLVELLREIARQLGKKITFFSCPFWLAYSGAWAVYLLSLGHIDLREKVQRLCEPRAYPHTAATEDFGYAPLAFPDGVRAEIEQYKQYRDG